MSEEKFVEYDEKVVEEVRQKLYGVIPKEYFQEKFGKRTPNYIKLLLVRETTGYLIIRSTEPDEVISTEVGNKEVVVIPSRKLKAREKLTGLLWCRKFGAVHLDVEYNFIKQAIQLANPNSLVFGDSVTEEREAIGLPARVLYEWSYSLRPKNEIIEELTHNALSEEGTMWDKGKGAHRESLYDVQYVKPGVYFPQFIVFPDITPEGFLHVLLSIIKTTRYGAQSNVMDANMKNHIVAIALDQFEPAISSYVLSKEWNKDKVTLEEIRQYAIEKLKECSKAVIVSEEETKEDNKKGESSKDDEKENKNKGAVKNNLQDLLDLTDELLANESKLKEVYKKLLNDSIAYLIECKIIKENDVGNYLSELQDKKIGEIEKWDDLNSALEKQDITKLKDMLNVEISEKSKIEKEESLWKIVDDEKNKEYIIRQEGDKGILYLRNFEIGM